MTLEGSAENTNTRFELRRGLFSEVFLFPLDFQYYLKLVILD